jgi:hypothetical protein
VRAAWNLSAEERQKCLADRAVGGAVFVLDKAAGPITLTGAGRSPGEGTEAPVQRKRLLAGGDHERDGTGQ